MTANLLTASSTITTPGPSAPPVPQDGTHLGDRLFFGSWSFRWGSTLLACLQLGTGGQRLAFLWRGTPTGGGISLASQSPISTPLATRSVGHIVPSAQLRYVRRHLSLNVSQLAKVLSVQRPTIYKWIKDESIPRARQAESLNNLYSIANWWAEMSGMPVGKYVTLPVIKGRSLVQLLANASTKRDELRIALESIRSILTEEIDSRIRARYRSAASLATDYGFEMPSEEEQKRNADSGARRTTWSRQG